MRKFRRKGVGRQAAIFIFEQFKGVWEVRQTYANQPAYSFWKKVISDFTKDYSYQEEMMESELWKGPVIVFQSI